MFENLAAAERHAAQRIVGHRHVRFRRTNPESQFLADASRSGSARRARLLVNRLADPLMPLLPSRIANRLHTRLGDWDDYFRVAEGQFDEQWDEVIWPAIQEFDFDTTLELSPGGGRNTQRLSTLASRLIVVDYNQDPLDRTEARLGTRQGDCRISYHRNNGSTLPMVADASVTAVYCWDSAVHFDKAALRSYIAEFARVLQAGGSGFLHHSDLGDSAHKNIQRNPDWRSNGSKALVADACRANGLTITTQQPLPWKWSMDTHRQQETVDCVTVFRKPD